MLLHHTSTQQQRAVTLPTVRRRMSARLDLPGGLWADGIGGAGRASQVSARSPAHRAKEMVIAEMCELDAPVTSKRLYINLERALSLKAIEYHLSTLVKTKVVEIVLGPELHFQLVNREVWINGSTGERCR